MAKVPDGVETLPKNSSGCVGHTNVTDDRQTMVPRSLTILTMRQTTDGSAIAIAERNVVTFG